MRTDEHRQRRAALAAIPPTLGAFARCAWRTARLGARGELHLTADHVGWTVVFDDGSSSRVYRETVSTAPRTGEPCLLVVAFRLRFIRRNRVAHAVFRAESLLNTPLFAGFPGFRSKLWLTDPGTGEYRGVYEWDGPEQATSYAQTLSRLLRLVSCAGSVRHHVEVGATPAGVLAGPSPLPTPQTGGAWWQARSVHRPAGP